MTNNEDTIEQFVKEVGYQKDELIRLLNPGNNILLITHTDMDGIGCEMVVSKFCPKTFVVHMGPNEIDKVMESLDTRLFDCIIITDLCCSNSFILSDPRVITIDHHSSAKKCKNPVQNIFINEAVSATRLVYFMFRTILDEDIGYMDEFCTIVDDYDTWKMKDSRSKILNFLFDSYGADKFKKRFGKTFDPEVTDAELSKWYKELERIDKVAEKMPVYVRDYHFCKIGVIVNDEYKNEYCEKLFADKELGLDLIIYVWYSTGGSVRLNNHVTGLNLGEMISGLKLGGGHAYAGGFHSTDKTVAGTLEAIRDIIDCFVKTCEESNINEINTATDNLNIIGETEELTF